MNQINFLAGRQQRGLDPPMAGTARTRGRRAGQRESRQAEASWEGELPAAVRGLLRGDDDMDAVGRLTAVYFSSQSYKDSRRHDELRIAFVIAGDNGQQREGELRTRATGNGHVWAEMVMVMDIDPCDHKADRTPFQKMHRRPGGWTSGT